MVGLDWDVHWGYDLDFYGSSQGKMGQQCLAIFDVSHVLGVLSRCGVVRHATLNARGWTPALIWEGLRGTTSWVQPYMCQKTDLTHSRPFKTQTHTHKAHPKKR